MSDRLRPFGPADTRAVVLAVAWRALRRGCLIRGDDGVLYVVVTSGRGSGGRWALTLACGSWCQEIEGSADDAASALVPGVLADAVALCRAGLDQGGLGASLIAVALDASGGDEPDLIWRGETTGGGSG